ncbi:MAG: MBL fold metallo-hydrolase [Thaumarchaeota archaeon]|nr:MBL fold metallo-hydrolase [Candidatus Calditenuaceae archaeon]MDW8187027.1 MBL fold metallo-hydrolase [Nitrososphaerota archaeon]
MIGVTHIGKGVYMIDNGGLYYDRTNATYVVRSDGKAIVVDTGYASRYERVKRALASIGVSRDELSVIALTHVHLDHCGAASKLVKDYPNATVIVHPKGSKHLIDPTKLLESTRSIFRPRDFEAMGGMDPMESSRVVEVSDEEDVEVGGVTLRTIYTPGHAPHHVAYLLLPHNYVFVGDALSTRGVVFSVPLPDTVPPKFDYEQGLRSIERIFELGAKLIFLTHYGSYLSTDELKEEELSLYRSWFERIRALKNEKLDHDAIAEAIIRDYESVLRARLHPVARDWIRRYVLGAYLSV